MEIFCPCKKSPYLWFSPQPKGSGAGRIGRKISDTFSFKMQVSGRRCRPDLPLLNLNLTLKYNSVIFKRNSKGDQMNEQEFSIQELCDRTGLPRRTIHFYTQQEIIPPPASSGLGARYQRIHLVRLNLIPVFRQQGLRLDDIRQKFMSSSPDELENILTVSSKIGSHSKNSSRTCAALAGSSGCTILSGIQPSAWRGCHGSQPI